MIDYYNNVYAECTAYGRTTDKTQAHISYISLKQHPKAKELLDKFNPNTIYSQASIAEKSHFDNESYIEFNLFFEKPSVICHDRTVSYLDFYIDMYALYKLNIEKIIELYSFDTSSTLSSMKINYKDEIIVPSAGSFVISVPDKNLEVILKINKRTGVVDMDVYTKTYEDFSKFDLILRDARNKYNVYEGKLFDQKGAFLDAPEITFDDIFLEDSIRKEVKENIIDYIDLDKVQIKQKNGLPTKRGMIFVGVPGTGKSFLCKVLANTLKTTFMVVTNISGVNEINDIFTFASKFDRIIILFEDIDIYIGDRELGAHLLPTMLNAIDGVQINNNMIILCTTNNLKGMDKALRERPGRFDRVLKFNPPNIKLKVKMLEGICKGKNTDHIDFEKIAESVPNNYTGAHIKEIYITACNEAIKRKSITEDQLVVLTTDIFLEVIKNFKLSKDDKKRVGFDENIT